MDDTNYRVRRIQAHMFNSTNNRFLTFGIELMYSLCLEVFLKTPLDHFI